MSDLTTLADLLSREKELDEELKNVEEGSEEHFRLLRECESVGKKVLEAIIKELGRGT